MDEKKQLLNDMFGNPVGEYHGAGVGSAVSAHAGGKEAAKGTMQYHMGAELTQLAEADANTPVKVEELCPHY